MPHYMKAVEQREGAQPFLYCQLSHTPFEARDASIGLAMRRAGPWLNALSLIPFSAGSFVRSTVWGWEIAELRRFRYDWYGYFHDIDVVAMNISRERAFQLYWCISYISFDATSAHALARFAQSRRHIIILYVLVTPRHFIASVTPSIITGRAGLIFTSKWFIIDD